MVRPVVLHGQMHVVSDPVRGAAHGAAGSGALTARPKRSLDHHGMSAPATVEEYAL